MMDSPESERFLRNFGVLFDDNFGPVSINVKEDRLLGIELLMRFPGQDGSFLLQVESLPLYMERQAIAEEAEDSDTESIYMIAENEVLPHDLMQLKTTPFESLASFLIAQTSDDEA